MASSRCGVHSPVGPEDVTPLDAVGARRIAFDQEVEDGLGLTAADCQHAMRWYGFDRLAEVVIHLELFLHIVCIDGLATDDHAFVVQHLAQRLAQLGRFGDALGQDVPGAFERFVERSDLLFYVQEGSRESQERLRSGLLRPDTVGERLETALAGDRRLGAALGAIRKVQIFKLTPVQRGLDLGAELFAELALLLDGRQDCRTAAEEVLKVRKPLLDQANLHLVERSRGFLPVACDERDRAAFLKQTDGRAERGVRDADRHGEVREDVRRESLEVTHVHPSWYPREAGKTGRRRGDELRKGLEVRAATGPMRGGHFLDSLPLRAAHVDLVRGLCRKKRALGDQPRALLQVRRTRVRLPEGYWPDR